MCLQETHTVHKACGHNEDSKMAGTPAGARSPVLLSYPLEPCEAEAVLGRQPGMVPSCPQDVTVLASAEPLQMTQQACRKATLILFKLLLSEQQSQQVFLFLSSKFSPETSSSCEFFPWVELYTYLFFLAMLRIRPRVSHKLDKYTAAHEKVLKALVNRKLFLAMMKTL